MFVVEFSGAEPARIPVLYGEFSVTIEGWEGSIVEIWCDGVLVG
jgi:hypothetical protein